MDQASDSIIRLIEALEDALEARREYRERAKNIEYDRDYYLSRNIDDVNRADVKVEEALNIILQKGTHV